MEPGLLAAVVASAGDAIISKDLHGVVTSWNPAAERIFGIPAEEIVGRNILLIAEPGHEADAESVLEKVTRGERIEHYDVQRRHRDGSPLHLSLTISPIHDVGGRVVGVCEIAREYSERRRSDERLRLLMNELDHRAKNVLAVTQAILRLTRADTIADFVGAVEGRIRALSRVHSQVAENRWEGAELRTIVESSLEAFGDRKASARIEGERLWLTPSAAQVLGILLHELATNAAKHGSLSRRDGLVEIRWTVQPNGELRLSWREQKGPAVATPTRKSFGRQVIERNVPDQLGGTAELHWHPLGLQCEFVVPADHLIEAPVEASARLRRA